MGSWAACAAEVDPPVRAALAPVKREGRRDSLHEEGTTIDMKLVVPEFTAASGPRSSAAHFFRRRVPEVRRD
jgi:hypothetical protein